MENTYDNIPNGNETQPTPQSDDNLNGGFTDMNSDYQYSYGDIDNQETRYHYQGNNNPNYNNQSDKSVLSMGDWLITLLVLLIPCVGIILYFVWAFGKNENENRKNYCKAYLIYWAITVMLGIILFVFFGAIVFQGINNVGYYSY